MKSTAIVLITSLAVCSALASSAQTLEREPRYHLGVGKGIEVCEAFLARANALPADGPQLHAYCEAPLDKADKRFSQPEWTPVDYRDHLDVLKRIFWLDQRFNATGLMQAMHPNEPYPDSFFDKVFFDRDYWEVLKPKLLDGFASGKAIMQRAIVDLDNDTKPDTVYRMTIWSVLPMNDRLTPAAERRIVFADPCAGGLGPGFRYFREGEQNEPRWEGGFSKYAKFSGAMFRYKNRTYYGLSTYEFGLTSRTAQKPYGFDLVGSEPKRGYLDTTCAIFPKQ